MKIEIEIPTEFEVDFKEDKFKDFFYRVLINVKGGLLCGNYEKETAEMFIKAFDNAKEDNSISKDKIIEKIDKYADKLISDINNTLSAEQTTEELKAFYKKQRVEYEAQLQASRDIEKLLEE